MPGQPQASTSQIQQGTPAGPGPDFGTPGTASSSGTPLGTPVYALGPDGLPLPKQAVIRGRRTASLQALQGVLLTPTGKVRKVHECPEPSCTAAFRRSEHLKRHYKSVHIGRRPFPCDWEGCDKTFSRNDNKQQHMSMVHGVKLPTAQSQSPPPAGLGGAGGGQAGQSGIGAGGSNGGLRVQSGAPEEKETDGGPELAEAFRRKAIRDAEGAKGPAPGLSDLLAAALGPEAGDGAGAAQDTPMDGVEEDAEGEVWDEETETGQAAGQPPAKKLKLE